LRNPRSPGGYILPQSVRDEPLGQGVRTTHYTKRGTIFGLVPEIVTAGAATERMGVGGIFESTPSAGRLGVLSGTTLGGRSTLGALGDAPAPGGSRDGVAALAKEASAIIMAQSRTVEPAYRKIYLQAVLGNIDRGLPNAVSAKAEYLMKRKNYDAKTALQKAIAVEIANHTIKELMEVGRTRRVPTSGLLGLGACSGGPRGLGGVWDTVKSYTKKTTGAILAPATAGVSLAWTAPKTAGKVADKAKTALDKIGKVMCKVADSGLLKIGAAAAGGAAGGPQGAQAGSAGADATQQLCAAKDTGPMDIVEGGGIPIVPILIGGGVLAVILLLR
jgi:hypothetical protein